MKISQKTWQKYISDLRKLSDAAADQFAEYLGTHDVSTSEGIQTAIDYAYALATKYGEGSSEMACQMYDAVAAASGKHIRPAEPAKTPSYGDVAKAVRGMMKTSNNPDYVASSVGRQVKLVGVDTMMKNALRDGAEWAWIPSGDSCPFCLMLASNGWQKASKKAIKNGHAEHVHANCDCTYAVRFSDDVDVEGYNPEALREQYDDAEGMSSKEKINYLRRQKYAANAEAIREQKRAEYLRLNANRSIKIAENNGIKLLKNKLKNGIINIDVDELVPCIRDLKTGEFVDTTLGVVVDRTKLKGYNSKTGWYINWQKVPKDCTILALRVKGDDEIQGLVAFKGMPDHKTVRGHWAVTNPKSNKQFTSNPEYSGIGGHLFAAMADASVNMGYGGFIEGTAANSKLLDYYIDKLGAKRLGGLDFYIDEEAARKLIEKYNWEVQ